MGIRGLRTEHVLALFVGLLSIVASPVRAQQRRAGPPFRNDIVASFSSGTVLIDVDGSTAITTITGGRMALSTDNVHCTPTTAAPCPYTVLDLRVAVADFSIEGLDFEEVALLNAITAVDRPDDGSGLHVRPVIPYWVFGRLDGEPFGFRTTPDMTEDVLEIMDLVVTPTENHATIFGHLSGTIGSLHVRATIMASADEPFDNVPPVADAGRDVSATTSCIADVLPDASGTFDPNGNETGAWWELNQYGLAESEDPVRLQPGDYDLTLVARDDFGGEAKDTTFVHVSDDGTSPPLPGMAVVSFEVPPGSAPERFALVGSDGIELKPNASVLTADSRGAPVSSGGALTMSVSSHAGESYVADDTLLRNRAWIEGALHAGAGVQTGHDVRIDGGILRDGPYEPGVVTSFYVPTVPREAPSVVLRPGEHASLVPGAYERIALGPGAVLELAPGVYAVNDLRVPPNAQLLTREQGEGVPSILAVHQTAFYHGDIVATEGTPSLLIAYLGIEAWTIHSAFNGWIVAPNATLVLAGVAHRGGFIARQILVQPHAVITQQALSWAFVRDSRNACALEPRVTCVKEGPGGLVAVFGYRNVLEHIGAFVPAGPFNRVDGSARPPPPFFWPGQVDEAFAVSFTERATWVLGGRTATATEGSTRCP